MVNRMKVKEIRELTTAEMLDQEKQLKEELFNLRFQLATGQLENTARIQGNSELELPLLFALRQGGITSRRRANPARIT